MISAYYPFTILTLTSIKTKSRCRTNYYEVQKAYVSKSEIIIVRNKFHLPYLLSYVKTNTPMKLLTTIAALLIALSAYSQDFIKMNYNTKWTNGVNELSFLERTENDKDTYKAFSKTSYLFYINLNINHYSVKDLKQERIAVRNCCMCSYTAILKNSRDTLRIEKGSSDDFGNSDIIVNTFYKKNEKLVHVKSSDDDSNIVTIWNPINSK